MPSWLAAGRRPRKASAVPAGAFFLLIVLVLFMGFAVAALLVLNDAEIEQSSTNVALALAERLFPYPWSYMAVIAVMLSSVGTLETSILQFTRTMYAKGRDGALHPRYAILHQSWRTPWVATSVIVFFGLLLLFLSSYYPSVNLIIKDSVNAIGFQVAFYYSLAGRQRHVPGVHRPVQHPDLRPGDQPDRYRRHLHWRYPAAAQSPAYRYMKDCSSRHPGGRARSALDRNDFLRQTEAAHL